MAGQEVVNCRGNSGDRCPVQLIFWLVRTEMTGRCAQNASMIRHKFLPEEFFIWLHMGGVDITPAPLSNECRDEGQLELAVLPVVPV